MKELSKVTKNERTGHAKYVVWFQNLYSLLLDSGPENPTTVGLQWNLTMDINLKKNFNIKIRMFLPASVIL